MLVSLRELIGSSTGLSTVTLINHIFVSSVLIEDVLDSIQCAFVSLVSNVTVTVSDVKHSNNGIRVSVNVSV